MFTLGKVCNSCVFLCVISVQVKPLLVSHGDISDVDQSDDDASDDDTGTPVAMATTPRDDISSFAAIESAPIIISTLPTILESHAGVHSEASLQAFMDSGLPGYIPECISGTLHSQEVGNSMEGEEVDEWDEGEEVLDLIDVRKHWTTPTEGLEGAWGAESDSLSQSQGWIAGDDFAKAWVLSDQSKHWNSDLEEGHGVHLRHWSDGEGAPHQSSHSPWSHDVHHSWSYDKNLSALWTDENAGEFKRNVENEGVFEEHHGHSWPIQHFMEGFQHWPMESQSLKYPQWATDMEHRPLEDWSEPEKIATHSQEYEGRKHWSFGAEAPVDHNLNESDPTKHWSLGETPHLSGLELLAKQWAIEERKQSLKRGVDKTFETSANKTCNNNNIHAWSLPTLASDRLHGGDDEPNELTLKGSLQGKKERDKNVGSVKEKDNVPSHGALTSDGEARWSQGNDEVFVMDSSPECESPEVSRHLNILSTEYLNMIAASLVP